MRSAELPLPPHFNSHTVETIWKVPYQERLGGAREWTVQHRISSAAGDAKRIYLLLVDVQNTFCIPDFEL